MKEQLCREEEEGKWQGTPRELYSQAHGNDKVKELRAALV